MSSKHPVWLETPIGFRWSQVVGEGDVLLAHSFLYFMINSIVLT